VVYIVDFIPYSIDSLTNQLRRTNLLLMLLLIVMVIGVAAVAIPKIILLVEYLKGRKQ